MKLSTKGQYGIHAMYELAQSGPIAPLSIKTIAERQSIPEAYLEQLLIALRKSGLLGSVRGAQGGYYLARGPEEITVGQVLRALEGELGFVECLSEDTCLKAGACPTRLVWQKLHEGLNGIVDGITLQDMLDDYERMSAREAKS